VSYLNADACDVTFCVLLASLSHRYRCLFYRVFEFTILNEDIEESMKQLKEAASYCFK